MAISTQTLAESSRLLELMFTDTLALIVLQSTKTVGINVSRPGTPLGDPIMGLVQSVSLESASEGIVPKQWSVKVPAGTLLEPGMAVQVIESVREPSLNGKYLLIDSVSENSLAVLRKGVAVSFVTVNQEGKS